MDKNKFGSFIRVKRIENKLTQKELADRLMLDVTAVSKWERGVNYPDITMIPDLCSCLGVSEHELIESSNDTEYRAIRADAAKYNKIKNTIFFGFVFSYAAAVLTCFLVDLAADGRLTWFFTVAAGCLCGFTFCPTCLRFFERYKLGIFALSTFVSLTLLFFACCASTGRWWLGVGVSGVLLGYFAVLYPILFRHQERYLGEERYRSIRKYFPISYAAGLFVLTVLVVVCGTLYTGGRLVTGIETAGYCFAALIVFGLIVLLPIERPFKCAIGCAVAGLHLYGLNAVLNCLYGPADIGLYDWYRVNFHDWTNCANGNGALLVLCLCVASAIVFTALGIAKHRRSAEEQTR